MCAASTGSALSLFAGLFLARHVNDVRLVFPRKRKGRADLELWASSETLKAASPYFKTLLESEFAECTTASSSKRRRVEPPSSAVEVEESAAGFEDSDDEGDDLTASSLPKDRAEEGCEVPFREIKLPQTASHDIRRLPNLAPHLAPRLC